MNQDQGGNREDGYEVGPGNPPLEGRWKKGQSGNPKGRPKGTVSITKKLIAKLRQVTVTGEKDKADEIVDALFDLATSGNKQAISAIKAIWDRVDGPVVQRIAGPEGEPLFLQKVFVGLDPEKLREGTLALPEEDAITVDYEEHGQGNADGADSASVEDSD